jgi:hypothetical protein
MILRLHSQLNKRISEAQAYSDQLRAGFSSYTYAGSSISAIVKAHNIAAEGHKHYILASECEIDPSNDIKKELSSRTKRRRVIDDSSDYEDDLKETNTTTVKDNDHDNDSWMKESCETFSGSGGGFLSEDGNDIQVASDRDSFSDRHLIQSYDYDHSSACGGGFLVEDNDTTNDEYQQDGTQNTGLPIKSSVAPNSSHIKAIVTTNDDADIHIRMSNGDDDADILIRMTTGDYDFSRSCLEKDYDVENNPDHTHYQERLEAIECVNVKTETNVDDVAWESDEDCHVYACHSPKVRENMFSQLENYDSIALSSRNANNNIETIRSADDPNDGGIVDLTNDSIENVGEAFTNACTPSINVTSKTNHSERQKNSASNLTDEVAQRAMTMASSMGDWAGRAVQKALMSHLKKSHTSHIGPVATEPPSEIKPSVTLLSKVDHANHGNSPDSKRHMTSESSTTKPEQPQTPASKSVGIMSSDSQFTEFTNQSVRLEGSAERNTPEVEFMATSLFDEVGFESEVNRSHSISMRDQVD